MAKQSIIVSVLADTKGLSKGLKDAGGMLGGLGGLAKTGAKVAVGAIAGIGSAVAGLAIGGGISRALKLDDARTQLGALGYTAKQVTGIMDSALASVDGTAFGLDAAATIAANALASGVKEGDALTKALTTVANTAALAKVDMGEMGGVFQKVWANGKVTTQEMNQLADRGVPIWSMLGDAFNVGTAELRKMVTAGEVTADMFEGALGPAVDGMAVKMGSSARSMTSNLVAALSRVGALFAAPAIEALKPWLQFAKESVDAVGKGMAPLADRFSAFMGNLAPPESLASAWEALSTSLGPVASALSPVMVIARNLGPVLPELADSFLGLAVAVGGALAPLLPDLAKLLDLVAGALATLLPLVLEVATFIVNAAAGVIEWATANRDLVGALAVVAGVIATVIAAGVAWRAVTLGITAATYGAQGAMLVAGASAKVYAFAMKGVAIAQNIATAAQKALNLAMKANPIGIIITAITALVAGLVWFFTQTETGQKIWGEFTRFLREAWDNCVTWITDALDFLGKLFPAVWDEIKRIVGDAAMWLLDLFMTWTLPGIIIKHWDSIVAFFKGIPGKIKAIFSAALSWLTSAGLNILAGLRNGAVNGWNTVTSWFKSIPSMVTGFFRNAGNWLKNAGRWVLDGFLNGLRNSWKKVTDFIGGIGDWIARNKGPKQYDLGLLVPAGTWIMTGLQKGIESQMPALGRTLDAVAAQVAGTSMSATMGYNLASNPAGALTAEVVHSAQAQQEDTGPTLVALDAATIQRLAKAMLAGAPEIVLPGAQLAGSVGEHNKVSSSRGRA